MATSNRFSKTQRREVGVGDSDNDDDREDDQKIAKAQMQESKHRTKLGISLVVNIMLLVTFWVRVGVGTGQSLAIPGTTESKVSTGKSNAAHYELYPFLVDSDKVVKSVSKRTGIPDSKILSNPTLPGFPVTSFLEDCTVEYKPAKPPRVEASNWRPRFWIPSFSGSGSSNPTGKGDLLKSIIEGLFGGDEGKELGYVTPVKNFHMSMKNRLKRCKGVSETVACSSGHPVVSTKPETQTDEYHRETILPLRNPATVIPISYAYKNIQYHDAEKQVTVEDWRKMRDDYFEGSFDGWIDTIKFWRKDSYYFTKLYVPFEDLVTTDTTRGAAMVKKISDTISGRNSANAKEGGFFETTTLEEDYRCLWYRTAKQEWEREQSIIGDYIPAYTQGQKDYMVSGLRAYATDVESDSFEGDQDAVLVSLLRRYADQIERYVLSE